MINIKKLVFLGLFSFVSSFAFAQDDTKLVKQQYIDILPLSYNLELPLGGDHAFLLEVGAGFLFNANITNTSSSYDLVVIPFLNLHYRNYYKYKFENKNGKPLFLNSGNYFFGQVAGSPGFAVNNIMTTPTLSIGGGWGMQRVYQNNFVFNFGIGLGHVSNGFYPVSLIGDLGLGILIGKNRQKKEGKN